MLSERHDINGRTGRIYYDTEGHPRFAPDMRRPRPPDRLDRAVFLGMACTILVLSAVLGLRALWSAVEGF